MGAEREFLDPRVDEKGVNFQGNGFVLGCDANREP